MTQTINKTVTFEEFANLDTGDKRYELHEGVIVEMAQPVGEHESVTGFLIEKILIRAIRITLPHSPKNFSKTRW